MYEEIQIKKKVDWKGAFTKLGVLLLVIIVIALIIALPSKGSYAESEFEHNLRAFMVASKEYFKDGNLPSETGKETVIKLQDLIDNSKLKDIDLESDKCNKEQSYAKITKLDKNEYSVYVYLECKSTSASSVDTIKL